MNKIRIAIIGAGPCGLAQLLAFKKAEEEQQVELVCFERQSDWGGMWLYSSRIGIDSHGEPIHSSMYRKLWSNNPKEVIEFADYTFHDHFGCSLPSYVPRAVIYDYLIGRAKANNLRRFIRFNTAVRHVDFNDKKKEFNIDIEDFNTGVNECLTFDRVVVAIGHYSVPNMIDIDGIDQFPGRILHSHEFRGADEFVGRNLLVVGGSFSAEDIALQCYKFGAKSIKISSSHPFPDFKWPTEIKEIPEITRIEGRTIHFQDNSTIDNIDAIIICTGFRHSYPFMAKRFRLEAGDMEFIPSNLYKSIFWIDQPNIAYLGAPRIFYSFPLFEGQAALVRDVFLNHIQLPDKNLRQNDINKWQEREKSIPSSDYFSMIDLQTDYMIDIYDLLRTYDKNQLLFKFDFNKANEIMKNFLKDKVKDIIHYRDIVHETIVGDKNRPMAHIDRPWIKNMDDTMENFLDQYRK